MSNREREMNLKNKTSFFGKFYRNLPTPRIGGNPGGIILGCVGDKLL